MVALLLRFQSNNISSSVSSSFPVVPFFGHCRPVHPLFEDSALNIGSLMAKAATITLSLVSLLPSFSHSRAQELYLLSIGKKGMKGVSTGKEKKHVLEIIWNIWKIGRESIRLLKIYNNFHTFL